MFLVHKFHKHSTKNFWIFQHRYCKKKYNPYFILEPSDYMFKGVRVDLLCSWYACYNITAGSSQTQVNIVIKQSKSGTTNYSNGITHWNWTVFKPGLRIRNDLFRIRLGFINSLSLSCWWLRHRQQRRQNCAWKN